MTPPEDAGANTPSGREDRHPVLVELSEVLVGTWKVEGPDISGRAEYRMTQRGCLVAYVDFQVAGSRMRVIQHINYDPDRRTLQARYVDTMGEEATYTWVLEDRRIRVSLGDRDSDT
jgi:hypothetical protein